MTRSESECTPSATSDWGLRREPASDLREGEDQIDGRPDEGDPADDRVTLGRGVVRPPDARPLGGGRFSRVRAHRRPAPPGP